MPVLNAGGFVLGFGIHNGGYRFLNAQMIFMLADASRPKNLTSVCTSRKTFKL